MDALGRARWIRGAGLLGYSWPRSPGLLTFFLDFRWISLWVVGRGIQKSSRKRTLPISGALSAPEPSDACVWLRRSTRDGEHGSRTSGPSWA